MTIAVAVDAGGGGDQERLWRVAEGGKGCGEGAGGAYAAFKNFALECGGPAMGSDVCAGEMDGG